MICLLPRPKKVKNLALANGAVHNRMEELTKRTFDFITALIGLMFLSPFFLIVAFLISGISAGILLGATNWAVRSYLQNAQVSHDV